MAVRCETISKYVLPLFRALVAKELINTHHLTQIDAAKRLGTTQAAISHYLNSKRAIGIPKLHSDILPKIKELAEVTAVRLAKKETSWDKVTLDFCKICSFIPDDELEQTGDNYAI